MEKIKFTANISKSGNSKVITVPAFFFEQNIVDDTKTYNITMKEVDTNGNRSSADRILSEPGHPDQVL